MLSYQHAYHAGGIADVVKHFTLTRILHYMVQKDNPMLYLETHSGRGVYDLRDKHALKTGEAKFGIEPLWMARKKLPSLFTPYLNAIRHFNHADTLKFYPGSPALAIEALRTQDRLYFCELHSTEFKFIEQLPHQGKRVYCSHSDGIESLRALLPPPERRGLIFVDPAYELKSEYRTIPNALKSAYTSFSTGVYCLWYPLVDNKLHGQLLRGLTEIGARNTLKIEFHLKGREQTGMTGCGLWIINPPYTLAAEVKTALNILSQLDNCGISSYLIE